MKAIYTLAIMFFALSSIAVAQDEDEFIRSYNQVRMMCSIDIPELDLVANEWSELEYAGNRVVFNDGVENNVVIYNADGSSNVYFQASEISEGTNDTGDTYQQMELTRDDGGNSTIMLFDEFCSLIHYYDDGSYLIIQYYP